MKYGFVIDNSRCIGCHACTTACKSENEVPLGYNRTWVKYTEAGRFPDVKRNFQVTRCNHCDNAPCVRICPVSAMYQRADGIVEFDANACIGCKACIQACPYDAIYMDPDTGTAAKCHFCSHRTDIGLEPACVVVCPVHAIVAGDMDDPHSEITKILAKEAVVVRKPEQGTAPKLFYVEGHSASLVPTAVEPDPSRFMFTDPLTADRPAVPARPVKSTQGLPQSGPIQLGGKMAEHMVQVGYNAQHHTYWHWQVPAYLVTKDIATGIFMIVAALMGLGLVPFDATIVAAAMGATLVFAFLTSLFLVFDLEHPERFLRIIFRPQWRSWLTRGAFLLIGFTLIAAVSGAIELAVTFGTIAPDLWLEGRRILMLAGLPVAFLTSVYTAFLFGQAEGRDLWQQPLLPVQFVVRSIYAGGAALAVLTLLVAPNAQELLRYCSLAFTAGLAVSLCMTLTGELMMPHATEAAAKAMRSITSGAYRYHFWLGFIVCGHIVPFTLALLPLGAMGLATATVLAWIGLFAMEYAFIVAPQHVPNS